MTRTPLPPTPRRVQPSFSNYKEVFRSSVGNGGQPPVIVPSPKPTTDPVILVIGASGYVGGRLVPALESRSYRVRCRARRPEYLRGRFHSETEVVRGDVLKPASFEAALRGIHTAGFNSRWSRRRAAARSPKRRFWIRLGLGGLVYWYGLYPIHWLICRRMLRRVAARAASV